MATAVSACPSTSLAGQQALGVSSNALRGKVNVGEARVVMHKTLKSAPSYLTGRLILTSVNMSRLHCAERRNCNVKASAGEGPEIEVAAEPAAPVDAPVNPIAALKLQSDLLKKKAKKLELRRKRLVRKRHLRKKGRWPPSKMKKNKNV